MCSVLLLKASKISCNYTRLVLDRRKATRGGVKLDDTIELDLSDTEERTAAFTTANNTAAGRAKLVCKHARLFWGVGGDYIEA